MQKIESTKSVLGAFKSCGLRIAAPGSIPGAIFLSVFLSLLHIHRCASSSLPFSTLLLPVCFMSRPKPRQSFWPAAKAITSNRPSPPLPPVSHFSANPSLCPFCLHILVSLAASLVIMLAFEYGARISIFPIIPALF